MKRYREIFGGDGYFYYFDYDSDNVYISLSSLNSLY